MAIDTTVCVNGHKKKNAPGLLIACKKEANFVVFVFTETVAKHIVT
jgi:hypothetical protein